MTTTRRATPGDPTGAAAGLSPFLTCPATAFGKPVCRLGLASRGDRPDLAPDDVLHAIERGVNFLNWPGEADTPGGPDALSAAIAALGSRRESVVVCVQFGARTAADAAEELRSILAILGTDYIDVLTFYYVERSAEWRALTAPGGALTYCQAAKQDGIIRSLGVTSHQRSLAAEMARSGLLDSLMIRYNAAHRGAEREVFAVTDAIGMPVIAYTALRWGALLQPTPDDPLGFRDPRGHPTGTDSCSNRPRSPWRWPLHRTGPSWMKTSRSCKRAGRWPLAITRCWPSTESGSAAMPAGSPDAAGIQPRTPADASRTSDTHFPRLETG